MRGKLRFVGQTDTGKVREHNEDTIAFDPDIGLLARDQAGGLHPVAVRHAEVHQDDVGQGGHRLAYRVGPVHRRADHLDPGQQAEQQGQTVADHLLVVGD